MQTSAACFLASIPLAVALLVPGVARAASPSRVHSDSAVVPAGGRHGERCGTPGCRHQGCCHAGGHHADCRAGHCVPYCPVRPGQFGFYGTQWRRWPGSGVVPASALDAATPVAPPRLEVPGPEEESPRVPEGDAEANDQAPAADDAGEPATVLPPPAEPLPLDRRPADSRPTDSRPSQSLPEPGTLSVPPAIEPPAAEPSAAAPAGGDRREEAAPAASPIVNPFDEASARGWRKFLTPVSASMPLAAETDEDRPASTLAPVVPPVRFDHLDEVRAAESARGR